MAVRGEQGGPLNFPIASSETGRFPALAGQQCCPLDISQTHNNLVLTCPNGGHFQKEALQAFSTRWGAAILLEWTQSEYLEWKSPYKLEFPMYYGFQLHALILPPEYSH